MAERPLKDVRSTTLERLRKTYAADLHVVGLPQPLQLGEGLYHLLDHIDLPVAPDDLLLGRIREEVPDAAGEAAFQRIITAWKGRGIPPWMPDGGHECFAWERLLEMGLPGLERFAQQELERRLTAGDTQRRLDFLRGAVRVYQALRHYARRYAAEARSCGLTRPAALCDAAASRPPRTFAEGLQLIWLVGGVYCTMLAANPTLTFGRMDWLLADMYARDMAVGRLTRAQAGALIADFYHKNDIILGRGEHQMSPDSDKSTGWQRNLTYDAPQYIVLGGQTPDDAGNFSDLTRLFLEQVDPRNENPVMVLRFHRRLPEATWRLACTCMRDNASFMVYNDENVIPAMEHCGIPRTQAVHYTMHGCNWPDLPGVQREVAGRHVCLPHHLLTALSRVGPQLTEIDTLYAAFAASFRDEIQQACAQLRAARRRWEEEGGSVLHVDDCFLSGPVATARSWCHGGVAYPTLTCALLSLATVADSITAVDELVVRTRQLDLSTLRAALEADFRGFEDVQRRCLAVPKFGQDHPLADAHAVRALKVLLAEVDAAAHLGQEDEVTVFRCLESDMRHIPFGAQTGATPDGRHAGQPLSENTSPYPGVCRNGLTAMLRSVSKLPLDRIHSGALNLRLQPNLVAGEAGLGVLMALLRSYLDMGGLQTQLSVVDGDTLREAQRCPALHGDLMVRITGYSAVFVDMARPAQDEIIRREEMAAM